MPRRMDVFRVCSHSVSSLPRTPLIRNYLTHKTGHYSSDFLFKSNNPNLTAVGSAPPPSSGQEVDPKATTKSICYRHHRPVSGPGSSERRLYHHHQPIPFHNIQAAKFHTTTRPRHLRNSPSSRMATPQEWTITSPHLDLHAELGEGPYYEPATHTLRFVDIINKRLHTLSLGDGGKALTTIQLDVPVTVTADIEGVDPREKVLVGLKYGLAVLDRTTGQYEYVAKFVDGDDGEELGGVERTRTNDGEVDPNGRFWVGTMTDFGRGDFMDEGSLYTFDLVKNTKQIVRSKQTIPNSVGWSPDEKTMYFTDTTARKVYAWDYDATTGGGSLSNERVFYHHQGPGHPDGFRVDKDGNLWHAVYGEAKVLKISPEGKVVGQIKLPTSNITCCEFVGTELYITTAADGAVGENRRYGGDLFRVDVGTTGLGHRKVKLPSDWGH